MKGSCLPKLLLALGAAAAAESAVNETSALEHARAEAEQAVQDIEKVGSEQREGKAAREWSEDFAAEAVKRGLAKDASRRAALEKRFDELMANQTGGEANLREATHVHRELEIVEHDQLRAARREVREAESWANHNARKVDASTRRLARTAWRRADALADKGAGRDADALQARAETAQAAAAARADDLARLVQDASDEQVDRAQQQLRDRADKRHEAMHTAADNLDLNLAAVGAQDSLGLMAMCALFGALSAAGVLVAGRAWRRGEADGLAGPLLA